MAKIGTGSFGASVAPQVNNWFGDGVKQFPAQYESFMKVTDMATPIVEFAKMSTLGLMQQVGESASVPYDEFRQLWTVFFRPATFKLGVSISEEAIQDCTAIGLLEKRLKLLGRAYQQNLNIIGANILNRSTNSNYVGGDGVSLISASHPTLIGGSVSNRPSVITTPFSEAGLEQAYLDIANFVDERGLKSNVLPKGLLLPPALMHEAKRILGSDLRVGTSDNDLNATKDIGFYRGGATILNYLTSDTRWFVTTDQDMDGIQLMFRKRLELEQDRHFDTGSYKCKGMFRVAAGWGDPLCIYGSDGI